MSDDRYRLGESLRKIGKELDHRLSPPESSEKVLALLRVLSEIDVPEPNPDTARRINRKGAISH